MAGNVSLAIYLRLTHSILHALTIILIVIGCATVPKRSNGTGTVIEGAFTWPAGRWLVLEILYAMLSLIVFSASWSVSINRTPCVPSRIYNNILKNSQHWILFYYSTMAMFVLYGCMSGCTIPTLFWYVPPGPPKVNENMGMTIDKGQESSTTWHYALITAVPVSGVNAVLYFVAAFVPLGRNTSGQHSMSQPQDQDVQDQKNKVTSHDPPRPSIQSGNQPRTSSDSGDDSIEVY